MTTPPQPERTDGTWLDLCLQSPESEAQAIAIHLLGDDWEAGDLAAWLQLSDFVWPSLDAWRSVYQSNGVVPPMWDEVLLQAPPRCPHSAEFLARVAGLSVKAMRLLIDSRGATGEAWFASICGGKDQAEQALEELGARGFSTRPADAGEALEVLGILELRRIQKQARLPGARSKEQLRGIILGALESEDVLKLIGEDYRVLEGAPDIDWSWRHYCGAVANLHLHTKRTEESSLRHIANARIDGTKCLEVSGPADGRDPVCDELDGEVVKVGDAASLLPHYPGCRCGYLPVVETIGED